MHFGFGLLHVAYLPLFFTPRNLWMASWLAMNGTISTEGDYKTQSALGYVPPPRAFHASAAFQNLLWITGGRTTPRCPGRETSRNAGIVRHWT